LDASSETEVWLAKKLKTGGMFTGNYNPPEELKKAKDAGFILNLDDISMIPFLKKIGIPKVLSFRINPGVGKATLESNVFAGPNAKYGVPFEKTAGAYAEAAKLGIKHFGIHMMTGSNVPIEEQDYFANIVKKLFEVVADVKAKTGIEIEFMNIGGGFGVPYRPEEKSLDMNMIARSIRKTFDEQCKKYRLKEPKLLAEPGRYIMADAGWLVSKVTVTKDSYKKFIGIDASSNDMPRPSIYGAYHHVSIIQNSSSSKKELVSVVGRICENNDQLAKDRMLPKCNPNDIIIIHNSGGHAFAMGHNYNGRLRHAEYLLESNCKIRQIRRAETVNDLYKTCNIK
jgi:diaminopimelate decarboxylase